MANKDCIYLTLVREMTVIIRSVSLSRMGSLSVKVVKIKDNDIEEMFDDLSSHNYYALIGKNLGMEKTSYDPFNI